MASKLAMDIANVTKEFDSDDLHELEVAVRKRRMELGPHKMNREAVAWRHPAWPVQRGRRPKSLHRATAEEIAEQLAGFTINADPPPPTDIHNVDGLVGYTDRLYDSDIFEGNSWYRKHDLLSLFSGREFTYTMAAPRKLTGVRMKVLKVNRTKARVVEMSTLSAKQWTIPLNQLIRIYKQGGFIQ